MKTITVVTGNAGKLLEWQRLFPSTYKLETAVLDLIEIQSFDPLEIAKDKAECALFQLAGKEAVCTLTGGRKTFAGMGLEAKDKIGHRTLAIKDLVRQLKDL